MIVTSHHTYRQESELLFHAFPLKRLWKYFLSLLEKRTYRLADIVTCVSGDTASFLEKYYSVSREKIIVIENPVDDVFFSESSSETRKEGSILYVGRIEERKGVKILLEAFAKTLPSFHSATLTLVGSNLIGDQLVNQLQCLNIKSRVRCTGYLSQENRIMEMRTADFLVVPSLLEGFGLVAAEAMALGTPVLVSDCDGLRSIVSHNETGIVFTSGSVHSLVAALSFALGNRKKILEFAQKARIVAVERFSRNRQAEVLRELLLQGGKTEQIMYTK